MTLKLALTLSSLLVLSCTIEVADNEDNMPPPVVTPIEPSKGPWRNNNVWGDKFEGAMPAENNQLTPVFTATEIVGPPRVQTIILDRDSNAPAGNNADFRAEIEYGIGADRNTFLVDWGKGVQFSLVANTVRVSARTYAPMAFAAYNPAGGRVRVGAGIAEGAVEPAVPPTLTLPRVVVADGNSTSGSPPDFARGVLVHAHGLANAPIPAGCFVRCITGLGNLAVYPYEDIIATGFIIPAGTTGVLVDNFTGGNITVTIQWILAL